MVDWGKVANDISDWISDYVHRNSLETLVVGVSGGIDSAVTSTLSAMTGIRTIVVNMPIHQDEDQYGLSNLHICLLYTSPSPRDGLLSRMPSSA